MGRPAAPTATLGGRSVRPRARSTEHSLLDNLPPKGA